MIKTNVSGVGLARYSASIKGEDGTLYLVAYTIRSIQQHEQTYGATELLRPLELFGQWTVWVAIICMDPSLSMSFIDH